MVGADTVAPAIANSIGARRGKCEVVSNLARYPARWRSVRRRRFSVVGVIEFDRCDAIDRSALANVPGKHPVRECNLSQRSSPRLCKIS